MTDFKKTELDSREDSSGKTFLEHDSECVIITWDDQGIALTPQEAWHLWELLPEYISAVTD